jgi:hypothetical protein
MGAPHSAAGPERSFDMIRPITAALAVAALLAMGSAVIAQESQQQPQSDEAQTRQITIVGELVDTACFVHSGGDAVGQGHAECAQRCLSSGIPAGVLPQGAEKPSEMKVILTNPRPLAEHAARTIRVIGNVYEGFENVIEPQQVFVQEGNEWREVQLQDEHHGGEHGPPGHGH